MSQAFIREGDKQSLSDKLQPGCVDKLSHPQKYWVRVYERKVIMNDQGTSIHYMSNGMTYVRVEGK